MIQLWAWEYEGKTEVGTQKPGNSCVFKSAASKAIPILRHTDHITNLRKVKVVDEDAVQERTSADLLWVHDGKEWRTRYAMWRGKPLKTKEDWDNYYLATNPPVTEPKNFGAIVEAETANWANRRKFVKLMGVDDPIWFGEKEQSYFIWSDLINPIIISEGVEG